MRRCRPFLARGGITDSPLPPAVMPHRNPADARTGAIVSGRAGYEGFSSRILKEYAGVYSVSPPSIQCQTYSSLMSCRLLACGDKVSPG
jgi:hypothetical protein